MGKSNASKTQTETSKSSDEAQKPAAGLFASSSSSFDPALASLFSASSGPVKAPKRDESAKKTLVAENEEEDVSAEEEDDEELSELASDASGLSDGSEEEQNHRDDSEPQREDRAFDAVAKSLPEPTPTDRKRKRKAPEDDLEARYLRKLADEEEAEQQQARQTEAAKRRKLTSDLPPTSSPPPQHESTAPSKAESELDKAARTVFLANVSITTITSATAKKTLLSHLSSHFSSLPKSDPPHKIESFRFRSTAYSSPLPKKAAFTLQELNEATSHSTNAYAVYSTKAAAREAARKLNGTVVLGRHLRVDEVAHPMKIDHRRCVFVGNLGFVDDETEMKAALAASEHPEDKKKAQSKALKSDVEEGLWVQFGKAGSVESVRVVRDAQTRVGKGIAYVQFHEENAVESALLFNGKKFPPMLPRKLRVTRCKKPSQTALAVEKNKKAAREAQRQEREQQSDKKRKDTGANAIKPEQAALQGRLKKMLGKAGVAEMRASEKTRVRPAAPMNSVLRPEPMVFEGHRATASQGNSGLKLGGVKKKRGQVKKRSERDRKRAAAYKSKGKAK